MLLLHVDSCVDRSRQCVLASKYSADLELNLVPEVGPNRSGTVRTVNVSVWLFFISSFQE